jgi:hypothetical protein
MFEAVLRRPAVRELWWELVGGLSVGASEVGSKRCLAHCWAGLTPHQTAYKKGFILQKTASIRQLENSFKRAIRKPKVGEKESIEQSIEQSLEESLTNQTTLQCQHLNRTL